MLNLNAHLEELEEIGTPIGMGLVGAGQMGRGLVSQLFLMKGIKPCVVCDGVIERAIEAYKFAGVDEDDIRVAESAGEAQEASESGYYVVTPDVSVVAEMPAVDVVVEATGVTNVGALVAFNSIANGKHVVLLNVETDVTVGPILKKLADSAGVVYTASAGDEPGVAKELYDFASGLGFEVLVIGKGKNNPLNRRANPDTERERAAKEGASPKMLASFSDGTKTMVEMAAVSNATGFLPDVPGMHGPEGTWANLTQVLRLKSEGGVLNRYGVVEYVHGVAPGVFVIVTSPSDTIKAQMRYLKLGDGPNYLLYRPFHLTSLETPVSVARAYLYREPTIAPLGRFCSEVVAVAKKDLKAGECLDGIGMYSVYGLIMTAEEACSKGALPIGLVTDKVKMLRDAKEGEVITYDAVKLDESAFVTQLRKMQDQLIK